MFLNKISIFKKNLPQTLFIKILFLGIILVPRNSFATTIVSTGDLVFSSVISGTVSSTLTLDLNNNVTVDSGDATLPPFATAQSGSISITGTKKSKPVTLECQTTSPPAGVTFGTLTPASVISDAIGNVATNLGITITIAGNLTEGLRTGTCTILATDSSNPPLSDTAVVNISLDIVAPADVDPETTALAFGGVVVDAAGGSVAVNTAGGISNVSGTAEFLGGHSRGEFNVTGEPSQHVSITYSSGDVLTGPGADMGLGSFTDNTSGGVITLGGAGNATLYVGATLTYGASQTEGSYSGTYTVIANY